VTLQGKGEGLIEVRIEGLRLNLGLLGALQVRIWEHMQCLLQKKQAKSVGFQGEERKNVDRKADHVGVESLKFLFLSKIAGTDHTHREGQKPLCRSRDDVYIKLHCTKELEGKAMRSRENKRIREGKGITYRFLLLLGHVERKPFLVLLLILVQEIALQSQLGEGAIAKDGWKLTMNILCEEKREMKPKPLTLAFDQMVHTSCSKE